MGLVAPPPSAIHLTSIEHKLSFKVHSWPSPNNPNLGPLSSFFQSFQLYQMVSSCYVFIYFTFRTFHPFCPKKTKSGLPVNSGGFTKQTLSKAEAHVIQLKALEKNGIVLSVRNLLWNTKYQAELVIRCSTCWHAAVICWKDHWYTSAKSQGDPLRRTDFQTVLSVHCWICFVLLVPVSMLEQISKNPNYFLLIFKFCVRAAVTQRKLRNLVLIYPLLVAWVAESCATVQYVYTTICARQHVSLQLCEVEKLLCSCRQQIRCLLLVCHSCLHLF